jgi:hypothetical protein
MYERFGDYVGFKDHLKKSFDLSIFVVVVRRMSEGRKYPGEAARGSSSTKSKLLKEM